MIAITLQFTSIEAARQALLEIPETALAAAPLPTPETKPAKAEPKKAEAKKVEPVAEKAEPKPEPVKEAPKVEQPAAIEYSVLQKAVFALAGKSREAAAGLAAEFGVKTFKELPSEKWFEALNAVYAKIEALEAA